MQILCHNVVQFNARKERRKVNSFVYSSELQSRKLEHNEHVIHTYTYVPRPRWVMTPIRTVVIGICSSKSCEIVKLCSMFREKLVTS